MKVGRMFINGKWKLAADGATRKILNPANNKVIGIVAEGTQKDAELAIQHARKAFDEGPWPQMRAPERASYLFKLADLIEQHAEELATMETRNNGKPLREAKLRRGGCGGVLPLLRGAHHQAARAELRSAATRRSRRWSCASRSACAGRSSRGTIRC